MKITNLNRPGVHAEGIVRGRNGRRAGSSGPNVSDVVGNEVDLAAFIQFDGATVTEIDADTALVTISGSGSSSGGIVTVTDPTYGALGDGTTDDTTAIQNAIDAVCTQGGGVVYFPPGSYLISATLTVTCDALWLVGDGVSSSILADPSMATDDMIEFTGDKGGMRDLELTSASQKTGGVGVLINGCQFVTLERLRLNNQYDSIKLLTSFVIRIVDCDLREQKHHGIWIDGATGNDFYLSGIVADNIAADATGQGIFISGGDAVIADHCDFLNFSNGLLIEPTAGRLSLWHFFDSMIFDQCTNNGITIGGAGDVHGATFVNCWSSSNTVHGAYIGTGSGAVTGITISASRFISNGRHGINVVLPATRVTLADNLVVSNSTSSSATYHGIQVEAGITHIQITGNHAYNGLAQGSTQGYGLHFVSGATDYLVLDGNDFQGNVTGEISNLAGVTGTHRWRGGTASDTGWSATTFWRGDGTWAAPSAAASGAVGAILIADVHSTPLVFADLLQTEAGDDLLYSDIA